MAPPDGEAVLDALFGAMAFPNPSIPAARRPTGVLLAARLVQHYAAVAAGLLDADVACRLEARSEAQAQALRSYHYHAAGGGGHGAPL